MKSVSFNENNNKIYITYSSLDYDRFQIDSILYQKGYRRISNEDWINIFILLNKYKCNEMIVHKDSIKNTSLANIELLKSIYKLSNFELNLEL